MEIIVVVVIVSILASLAIPRLLNTAERRAAVEAEQVRQLFTAVARRAATGGDTLAVVYDAKERELRVEERRAQPKVDAKASAAARSADAAQPEWVRSRLVPPVRLSSVVLVKSVLDGRPGPENGTWRLEMPRAFPRPGVSLLLVRESEPDGTAYQIDAGPDRTSARLTGLANPGEWNPLATRAVDLDSTGRRIAQW